MTENEKLEMLNSWHKDSKEIKKLIRSYSKQAKDLKKQIRYMMEERKDILRKIADPEKAFRRAENEKEFINNLKKYANEAGKQIEAMIWTGSSEPIRPSIGFQVGKNNDDEK